MKVRLIVNPSAGSGRARQGVPTVVSAFARAGETCEVAETLRPRHAAELLRQAASDGVELVVAMGGDGTFNEVAQGYVDGDGNPVNGPELGLVPFGTGGDFRRSFGLGHDIDEAVKRILRSRARRIDLGFAKLTDDAGHTVSQAFINVGSFGISGVVSRLVNHGPKWMGGKATFYLASARGTLGYKNQPVRLSVDGDVVYEGPMYLGVFANAQYFGGGMHVAPNADPSDGQLDCVVFGDLSVPAAFSLSSKIYKGTHLRTQKVCCFRGTSFVATPLYGEARVSLELDGETPGHLPLGVSVTPSAVALRT